MTGPVVIAVSNAQNEEVVKKTPEETQEERARKRKESQSAAIAKMIAEYNKQPFIYLKTSKIKEAVYSQILNPSSEVAKEDLKLARFLKNQAEYEEFLLRKKEFEEENKTSGSAEKWTEKFVPEYDFKSQNLTPFAKTLIKQAMERERHSDKEKYIKSQIKHWKENHPEKYQNYLNFRKAAIEKAEKNGEPTPVLSEIALGFDKTVLSGYVHQIHIKSKGETEGAVYPNPQSIPGEKKYDYYRTLLTRGNVRFSKASQTYISIFIEDLARQVAFNCIHHTRKRNEDKISTESLNLVNDPEFLQEFVPLANLIRFTKTYSEIEKQKFVREKKPRQKKSEKSEQVERVEKPKKEIRKEQWDKMSVEEKVIETLSQDHYLKNQISNNCKVFLALHYGEGEDSEYYRVKYSSFYVQFVAHLIGEVIYKIGRILKSQVTAHKSKTISQDLVKVAIEQLLISLNVDESAVSQVFNNLDAKFLEYEKNKPVKAKKDEDEEV